MGIAAVECHGIPGDGVFFQELPKDAGMLAVDMLEDEEAHVTR
jgi:hypothetical protein